MYKVLLVEDEELERRYLRSLLDKKTSNFQVIGEACNGREGIELSAKLVPDIVFMDIRMPGINGLAATKIIKNTNPNIRILLLSAYSDFNYAKQAIHLGVNEYLLKPAQANDILSALNAVTKNNSTDLLSFNSCLANDDLQDFITSNYPLEKEREIIISLQKRDLKLFNTATDDLIKEIMQNYHSFSTIKIRFYELITIISRALNDSGYSVQKTRRFKLDKFQEIAEINNSDDINEYLIRFKKDFLEIINLSEDNGYEHADRIISYISAHKADNISLHEIAAYFHFSPCHISRIIKRKTGFTYPQYFNKIRLAEAKELLRNSNLDISKIANTIGYNEVSHFNRIFKKSLGLSPSKYRNLFNESKEKPVS